MTLHDVSLNDKFDLEKDRVFLTGTQAVVRLLLMQKERDRRAGLNTAGFVSGYRGSPIGALDQQLFSAGRLLRRERCRFSARPQRGTGCNGMLGHAAGQPVWRGEI